MTQLGQPKTIHIEAYRALVSELRQARVHCGLTQAESGAALGRSRLWLAKVESSQIRLDVIQFVRLCKLYGLVAHEIVRRLEEEP